MSQRHQSEQEKWEHTPDSTKRDWLTYNRHRYSKSGNGKRQDIVISYGSSEDFQEMELVINFLFSSI